MGRLTVVETKLWRNPEATRQVVAQVIDYANRLSGMSYDEFEKACRTAREPSPLATSSLHNLVTRQYPREVIPEPEFIDAVRKTLRDARFLLVVVGDGIRENLEDMVGLLHQYPQMLFTFALVEMQIYESEALPGRLIVPQLVARTTEMVRAVVQIEGRGEVKVRVIMKPDDDGVKLSEQEFLNSINDSQTKEIFAKLISFANDLGYVECATRSVTAHMQYGGTGYIRVFRLYLPGTVKFIRLDDQLEKFGVDTKVAWDTASDLGKLFPQVGLKPGKPALTRPLKAGEVAKHFDKFVAILREAADRIKAIPPTQIPQEEEGEPEDDDAEIPKEGIDDDKK